MSRYVSNKVSNIWFPGLERAKIFSRIFFESGDIFGFWAKLVGNLVSNQYDVKNSTMKFGVYKKYVATVILYEPRLMAKMIPRMLKLLSVNKRFVSHTLPSSNPVIRTLGPIRSPQSQCKDTGQLLSDQQPTWFTNKYVS